MPVVTVLEGHSFHAWSQRHSRGECAGALPFGVDALRQHGYELVHSDLAWSGSRILRRLDGVTQPLGYMARSDGAIAQVIRALPRLFRSELVLSIFEDQGLAYALLRRCIPSLPPLVMMTCWLAERLRTSTGRRLRAYRALTPYVDAFTVFSPNQRDLLVQKLGITPDRVHFLPFGVDVDFYQPDPAPERSLVSVVGKDAGRDWPVFLDAAARLPDVRFALATNEGMVSGLEIPPNVQLQGELGHEDYRKLIASSMFGVVPTFALSYPTGQSVLLETMASGRPVVTARTGAIASYVDHRGAVTYEPGSATELAVRIDALAKGHLDRAARAKVARRVVEDRYSSAVMWREVASVLQAVESQRARR